MADKVRDEKVDELRAIVRSKQAAVDDLKVRMFRCNFVYTPPEPNFDSRRVMGTICSLIEWYNPDYVTALEVIAGELLFSVVVDTEETSTLLLEHGNLQRNTKFIMLNQVQGVVIHRELVNAAQEIVGGPSNLQLALDLVRFDSKYEQVMKFVFGTTLVCKDLPMAMKLFYNPSLQFRLVTQDGDVMEPDGMLTGGAPPEPSGLAMTTALKNLLWDLKMAETHLRNYTEKPYIS